VFTISNKFYFRDYSGTLFTRTPSGQSITNHSELRPDSPVTGSDTEVQDYKEREQRLTQGCEERMMAEARTASLESQEAYMREFTADLRTPTPHPSSRPPSPAPVAEYDETGRLTARPKGKGCVN
jgi:hypothetical protein